MSYVQQNVFHALVTPPPPPSAIFKAPVKELSDTPLWKIILWYGTIISHIIKCNLPLIINYTPHERKKNCKRHLRFFDCFNSFKDGFLLECLHVTVQVWLVGTKNGFCVAMRYGAIAERGRGLPGIIQLQLEQRNEWSEGYCYL